MAVGPHVEPITQTLTSSYHNRWQPWPAYWVIFWSSIVLVFNGWEVFTKGK
jgi:amino acid transporter